MIRKRAKPVLGVEPFVSCGECMNGFIAHHSARRGTWVTRCRCWLQFHARLSKGASDLPVVGRDRQVGSE